MAASYQTGTATSPVDLQNKLVAWLALQGWTTNMDAVDGSGRRAHLSKGSTYVNFRALMNETVYLGLGSQYGLSMYLSTAFNSGSQWYAQTGGPIRTSDSNTAAAWMQLPSGSINAYHFFDDGNDNIVVVVERATGIFTNMCFGPTITKAGTITGGAYFSATFSNSNTSLTGAGSTTLSALCPFAANGDAGTFPNSYIRADVDTYINKWLNFSTGTTGNTGRTGKSQQGSNSLPDEIPHYANFVNRQTSALTSQANLLPLRVFAPRDATPGGYSLLGEIPNIFVCNGVANGYSPASIISLGPDNYMLFPNFAVKKFA